MKTTTFSMKGILIGLVLFALVGILIGYKMYNKPHRSVAAETAIQVSATKLFSEFESDEAAANTKYLNKTIAVTGNVAEVSTNQEGKTVLILETENPMFGISCTLAEPHPVAAHTTITVKGICTGYLSDVVVVQGILIEK